MKLFDGKELFHKRIGEKDFDRVAGQGSEHIPVVLIQQQLDEIKQAVSSVEKHADRRIAHYDRRQPARPFPTFGDLTAAIKALEKIVILYWRLLKGPSMSTMLPTIMFDWKDIFRFVWEPPEAAGTQPLI